MPKIPKRFSNTLAAFIKSYRGNIFRFSQNSFFLVKVMEIVGEIERVAGDVVNLIIFRCIGDDIRNWASERINFTSASVFNNL